MARRAPFRLAITEPCPNLWSELDPRAPGRRYCAECDRTVVDLSRATAAQARRALAAAGQGGLCAWIDPDEDGYARLRPDAPGRSAVGGAVLAAALAGCSASPGDAEPPEPPVLAEPAVPAATPEPVVEPAPAPELAEAPPEPAPTETAPVPAPDGSHHAAHVGVAHLAHHTRLHGIGGGASAFPQDLGPTEGGRRTHVREQPPRRVGGDGRLEDGLLRRLLRRQQAAIRHCYETELRRQPDLAGRLRLEMEIGPDGRVTDAEILSSSVAAPSLDACVLRIVRRLRAPAPEGGAVRYQVGWDLEPG